MSVSASVSFKHLSMGFQETTMARTVGLASYHDKIKDMESDKDLYRVFAEFARNKSKEYETFLNYCSGNFNEERRYKYFFSPNAVMKIDLPSKEQEFVQQIAARKDWKDASYRQLIGAVEKHCRKVLDSKAMNDFFKSKSFTDYHCKQLTGRKDPNAAVKEAVKKLKLKNQSAIISQIFLEVLYGGRKSKIDSLNKQLEDTNTSSGKSDGKKRDVYAELKKNNFIRV